MGDFLLCFDSLLVAFYYYGSEKVLKHLGELYSEKG